MCRIKTFGAWIRCFPGNLKEVLYSRALICLVRLRDMDFSLLKMVVYWMFPVIEWSEYYVTIDHAFQTLLIGPRVAYDKHEFTLSRHIYRPPMARKKPHLSDSIE